MNQLILELETDPPLTLEDVEALSEHLLGQGKEITRLCLRGFLGRFDPAQAKITAERILRESPVTTIQVAGIRL